MAATTVRRVATHLLILGDRAGLGWVLENERMAFPSNRQTQLAHVRPDDTFLLYTTRGCFHNPTRDRGRVIGTARVTSSVGPLDDPVVINDREFGLGCDISVEFVLPRGEGIVLADLVEKLVVFPKPHAWSAALRRPLLTLPGSDARLLTDALGEFRRGQTAPAAAVASY